MTRPGEDTRAFKTTLRGGCQPRPRSWMDPDLADLPFGRVLQSFHMHRRLNGKNRSIL